MNNFSNYKLNNFRLNFMDNLSRNFYYRLLLSVYKSYILFRISIAQRYPDAMLPPNPPAITPAPAK